jgi:hypothetical protein
VELALPTATRYVAATVLVNEEDVRARHLGTLPECDPLFCRGRRNLEEDVA